MKITSKIINHLVLNGKKETSETNLLKSIKELQKNSSKKSHNIFQLALIYSTPIFKLHRIKNKRRKKNKNEKFKEIPGFIKTSQARTSLSIKIILMNIKKNKGQTFYKIFNNEILLNAKKIGNSLETKNEIQKKILNKKHYFRYYRWN